ncbi:ATPase, F1/V1/A1 complex, alpha/beta subunit, partial [Tanacetum coccineum]
ARILRIFLDGYGVLSLFPLWSLSGFLGSRGRDVKQKKGVNVVNTTANMGDNEHGITGSTINLEQNVETPGAFINHADLSMEFPSLETMIGRQTKVPTSGTKDSNNEDMEANVGSCVTSTTNMTEFTASFASLVINEVVKCEVNFRSLDSDKPINGKAEVKTHKASILDVHSRFGFSLYGYFVCKRVAFSVVENYIKNLWKKFGLVRVMMNSRGFFFFKFASIYGMDGVLENGPWFIRYAPIILKKWTPNANLLKEDLNSVPIWVKFHDIPIVAFTAEGLSVMATKLGNPIMANQELKEDLVIAIPNVEDDGEVLHTVRVEYEWEPPRCGVCMVFGHDDMLCPKRPVEKSKKQHTNHDGFQSTSSFHGTNVGSKVMSLDQMGGSSNSGKKVVQNVASSASSSPSNTPLVARINKLESLIIKGTFVLLGTLVLLDDDGKSLKPSKSTLPNSFNVVTKNVDDLVNEDNDSKVVEVYDETATYMAFTGFNVNKAPKSGSGGGNKSLYEQWKKNDDHGLIDAQMKFVNAFDINLRSQLR